MLFKSSIVLIVNMLWYRLYKPRNYSSIILLSLTFFFFLAFFRPTIHFFSHLYVHSFIQSVIHPFIYSYSSANHWTNHKKSSFVCFFRLSLFYILLLYIYESLVHFYPLSYNPVFLSFFFQTFPFRSVKNNYFLSTIIIFEFGCL